MSYGRNNETMEGRSKRETRGTCEGSRRYGPLPYSNPWLPPKFWILTSKFKNTVCYFRGNPSTSNNLIN
jgi:hypothetical protein